MLASLATKETPTIGGFLSGWVLGKLYSSFFDRLIDKAMECRCNWWSICTGGSWYYQRIPLAQVVAEDVLIWPFSNDGEYNYKSGYHFLKEESDLCIAPVQSSLDSKLWRKIWPLCVPQKMNILWRACWNAMPMKENLVRQTIIEGPVWLLPCRFRNSTACVVVVPWTRHCLVGPRAVALSKISSFSGLQGASILDYFAGKKPRTLCSYGMVYMDTKESSSPPSNSFCPSPSRAAIERHI